MDLIKIKDIKIRYDDNQEIDYIKNVINNNYNLFLSLLGESKVISLISTNDDEVVYISDFDKTFYDVVNQTFNEHEQKCYDYLEAVATFYLDETKPFAEGLNNLNFAVDKVKKLGGKSWLNSKK